MTDKQHRNRRLLKWARIAVWCLFAVILSRQKGIYTSMLSYGISERISILLDRFWINLGIEGINFIIRKSAHVIVYFVLGCLVSDAIAFTLKKATKRMILFSVLICLAAASLDELQKLFIAGRHCDPGEILLNAVAAVTGILIIYFVMRRANKRSRNI